MRASARPARRRSGRRVRSGGWRPAPDRRRGGRPRGQARKTPASTDGRAASALHLAPSVREEADPPDAAPEKSGILEADAIRVRFGTTRSPIKIKPLNVSNACSIIGCMDKTIHSYTSLDAMKADEYREWHELPPCERLNAAAALSIGAYRIKDSSKNVSARLQRTLVRLQQPEN